MTSVSATSRIAAPPAQLDGSHENRLPIPSLAESLRHHVVLVVGRDGPQALGARSLAQAVERRYETIARVIRTDDISADEIRRIARKHRAGVIAFGLPRRRLLMPYSRSRRTVLTLMHHAATPVLAVAPHLRGFPRRAVVGINFGPASIRAAKAALDLLARPGSSHGAILRLVYIDDRAPRERLAYTDASVVTTLGVRAALEWVIGALDAPAHVRVDASVREGAVPRELLRFATETKADLIAIGTPHRASGTRRLTSRRDTWRVAAPLLRDGRYSVLAVPPF